jgi:uncharacterized protein YdeI (YjbR/CyaY-like superfamily)
MSKVDAYIERSERWSDVIASLRSVLLGSGLTEDFKWRKPCYTHEGKNIVIVQEMKDFLALMFFKGALIDDPNGFLVDQGPNSRSARRIELTSVDDVELLAEDIAANIERAIAVEAAGLEVGPPPELDLVDELRDRIETDPAFKAAFEGLTPGRQREYNLFVSGAKQASTRASRVDRHTERILAGKGLRDRWSPTG